MEQKSNSFRIQVLETMATLITAGFGIVAALAWNEAIKQLINEYLPNTDSQTIGLFVYAIIVTVIVVAATLLVSRALAKLKEADAKLTERVKSHKDSEEECGCANEETEGKTE